MMAQDKAARILDAAEALLLAYGYGKVTIDEVARRAGVGKGTVYLYWPGKRELFAAVITRDTARRVAEYLAALAADPAEVRLHRAMRHVFLHTMTQPLARALATGDTTMLGEVLTRSEPGSRFTFGKIETTERYLVVLYEHGLLADDPATDSTVITRLSAVLLGSFLIEVAPDSGGLPWSDADLEGRADALVTTLRRAFEPDIEPSPDVLRAAAGELADLHRQWLRELTDALPESTLSEVRT